ncbi:MAG: PAS domain-containing sensor histidine kinase [candidate division Zixibacteria bacterium]
MDNLYKTYFKALPCYLTIQDRDFKIIDANENFVKNFGDFRGRYCYQIYKKRPEKCEDCPVERTFLDGKRHRSEELVKTLDGREVSVIVYATPIHDEDGKITSVMEMSTNITEIKMLQKQLKNSQEKYRLLFEEVPCFISIQDRNLRIVEANRLHREAFGTFYGCKCYEVYKHRDKACHPCAVLKTFDSGKVHLHEEVVVARDGRQMNVMVMTAPIYNDDGEIESVIEMSTDITQIRELQTKLSSVGMIISTISHDLKGLLNGMDGGIYLVNTGMQKEDRDRIDKGWEMVLRNVDRIRSTVLDILYYAKDREPEWSELRLSEIIEEIYSVMKPKAESLKIDFSKEIILDNDTFKADSNAIRSMLINLIDNSFDACRVDKQKENHEVMINITGDSEEIRFEISDNGIGMDQETREKAFTLFFSSKGSGGTGLGLFIANKIAQSHGSNIEIESEPGVGTKISIVMPRDHVDSAASNESEDSQSTNKP